MITLDPLKIYFREIKKIPPISKPEFEYLFRRMKKGNEAAKRRLIEGNLRLVISIAKRFYNQNVNFLDLIEEGNLGLIRAIEKFKISKKTSFSTYATLWIKQSIKRALQNKEKTIRVPYHAFQKIKNLLKTYENIRLKIGKQPRIDELAKVLNISIDEMKKIIRDYETYQDTASMDDDITDDESLSLKDVIADTKEITPEKSSSDMQQQSQVLEVMKTLKPKQQFVIEHRFGLNGKPVLTLEEIGKKLRLSRERVRQIELLSMNLLKRRILKVKNFEML